LSIVYFVMIILLQLPSYLTF